MSGGMRRVGSTAARSARLPLAQVDLEVSDSPHGVLVPKVDLHEVLLARLA